MTSVIGRVQSDSVAGAIGTTMTPIINISRYRHDEGGVAGCGMEGLLVIFPRSCYQVMPSSSRASSTVATLPPRSSMMREDLATRAALFEALTPHHVVGELTKVTSMRVSNLRFHLGRSPNSRIKRFLT